MIYYDNFKLPYSTDVYRNTMRGVMVIHVSRRY